MVDYEAFPKGDGGPIAGPCLHLYITTLQDKCQAKI